MHVPHAMAKYIDHIGHYNPIAGKEQTSLKIDQTKIAEWLAKGAQPSQRVRSLLKLSKKMQHNASIVA